ncbi:hypothetical protein [Bosea thiooxidans]
MEKRAEDKEAADMQQARSWSDDTPDSEFARILPPRRFESWIVVGFWLLVVAVMAGRLALPGSATQPTRPAAQATMQ